MKKLIRNSPLWRRSAVIFGALFVISLSGNDIASSQANAINHALGTSTYQAIKTSDETVDSEYFKSSFSSKESLHDYCKDTGEQIEAEGCVLLKNDHQALPLSKNSRVSLFGTASARINYASSGSSSASGVVYPKIEEVFGEKGIEVNPTLLSFYKTGEGSAYGRTSYLLVGQVNECPFAKIDSATLDSVKEYGDAAIVILARDAGEGSDVGVTGSDGEDGSYLSISPEEEGLLKGLSQEKAAGNTKKIVVLLNTAVPIETDFLFRDGIDVDSCLWIGNVGTYGLNGVADVLTGSAVPSGKLNDTFLRDNMSSPAMASWLLNPNKKFSSKYANAAEYKLNATQNCYAVYQEGIYLGYRYYETRYADQVSHRNNVGDFDYSSIVSYPFGYGLSYTDFAFSDFSIAEKENAFEAQVKVTNTGSSVSGKEVAEFYLQKPYTDYDQLNGVEKSAIELVGFAKTGILAPGAFETLAVTIDKEALASYDSNGAKTYILDQGDYYLSVGFSSHNALNNVLALQGYTMADGMSEAGDSALAKVLCHQDSFDAETYSLSKETGKAITNQLDFMDVNHYENAGENHVKYVTRRDWKGSWPTEAVVLNVASSKMAFDLSSDKPMEETSKEFPNYGIASGLQLISLRSTDKDPVSYEDPRWNALLDQMSYQEQSLLMTSAGFSTVEMPSVGKPATKDNDGPTAIVGTLTGSVFPSKGIWASTFNKELINQGGKALAEDTRFAGYQSLYAPGVNLHRTPFGGRLNEYYSEDAYLSGEACVQEVKGIQSKGVIPTVKHFAFNNEETNRNGVSIWMNEQEAREIMLKPFEMALRPSIGNAHAIMTSFNRAGCIWTSASANLMIAINRDEWGFDGYSLTDMAASNAAAYMLYNDGFYNGTDLFLRTGSEDALSEYRNNATFCQRMRESCHRVLYVIANFSSAMNGISSSTIIVKIIPWWQVTINVVIGVSGSLMGVSSLLLGLSYYLRRKEA